MLTVSLPSSRRRGCPRKLTSPELGKGQGEGREQSGRSGERGDGGVSLRRAGLAPSPRCGISRSRVPNPGESGHTQGPVRIGVAIDEKKGGVVFLLYDYVVLRTLGVCRVIPPSPWCVACEIACLNQGWVNDLEPPYARGGGRRRRVTEGDRGAGWWR